MAGLVARAGAADTTFSWDTGPAGFPAVSSGTWNAGTTTNWTTDGGVTKVSFTSAADSNAIFGGTDGTYAITVAGPLTVGALTFSNDGYTLSAGSLQTINLSAVNSTISIASGKTATLGSNVTLTTGQNYTINGGGTFNIDSGATLIQTSAKSIGINGAGTIVNVNGGTLSNASINGFLSVTNGTLNINSGIVSSSGTIGTLSFTLGSSGVVNLNGGTLSVNQVTGVAGGIFAFNGGTLQVKSSVLASSFMPGVLTARVQAGGAIIDTNGVNATLAAILNHDPALGSTPDGGLTKIGAGTLTLSGANNYTGATTINEGVLSVADLRSNSRPLGSSGAAATNLILNGGTLRYTGAAGSPSITARLFSVGTNNGTIDASGSGAVSFTATGSMGFNGQSGARLLTLTGTNTGSNTLAAVIGDNGGATSLAKTGVGTWVLSGTNTYTGTTSVNGGTLLVNGSITTSTMTVVNNGAVLGGSGTTGSITLNSGGTLAPGNSIGTLSTNNKNATWNGGGLMAFELDGDSNSSDRLNLGTGTLGKGTAGAVTFDFLGTGGLGYTYTLINFGSTDFSWGDFSYSNLASGLTGNFILNANSLQFMTMTAIPEPSAVMAAAMLGLSFLVFRRGRCARLCQPPPSLS